jgi:uncharacterized iron-regulated protein
MKVRIRLLALLLTVAAILFLARQWDTDRVLRIADGRMIGQDEMIGEIRGARLVFVGENHGRPGDHRTQLKIIAKLYRQGVPLAIGLEMFSAGSQHLLDSWGAGRLGEEDFIKGYYREWPMPWTLYRDIFRYARKHAIPLVGLNVPRAISRKVAREGFAALTPAELRELPAGVSCSIDSGYRAFIRRAYAAHGEAAETFEHFCEAQMLWNMGMGMHLLGYCDRHPDTTVIVLTGVGHAMKQAIPIEVTRRSRVTSRVILPEFSHLDRSRVTVSDADYLVLRN